MKPECSEHVARALMRAALTLVSSPGISAVFPSRDHRERRQHQVGQVPDLPFGGVYESVDTSLILKI
jgi:hypothetical protein